MNFFHLHANFSNLGVLWLKTGNNTINICDKITLLLNSNYYNQVNIYNIYNIYIIYKTKNIINFQKNVKKYTKYSSKIQTSAERSV